MSAATHTPGPWTPDFGETYAVIAPDGGRIAISTNLKGRHGLAGRRTGNEVECNTRLIAAAPELLLIAQLVANIGEYGDLVYQMAAVLRPHERETFIKTYRVDARAAIAKATGEQA